MSSEKFAKAGQLFDSALACRRKTDRISKEACGEDQYCLRSQSSVAAHHQAKDFMQTPAFKNVDLTPAEDQLSEGQQIGAYKIVRQIGRGGMGAVYLAERADNNSKNMWRSNWLNVEWIRIISFAIFGMNVKFLQTSIIRTSHGF